MTEIRWYLLRLVICAFAASVAQTLVVQPKLRRVVRLTAACLLAIVALQPLVTVDLASIPEVLQQQLPENPTETAREKNNALLESLIRQQTEAAIREKLDAIGIEADFTLGLQYDADVGAPVPWEISLQARCTDEQAVAMIAFLRDELGIPEARQDWRRS